MDMLNSISDTGTSDSIARMTEDHQHHMLHAEDMTAIMEEDASTFTSNKLKKVRNIAPEVITNDMIKYWFREWHDRMIFQEWSGSALSKPIVTRIAERVFGVDVSALVHAKVIPKDTISHLVLAIKRVLLPETSASSNTKNDNNNNNEEEEDKERPTKRAKIVNECLWTSEEDKDVVQSPLMSYNPLGNEDINHSPQEENVLSNSFKRDPTAEPSSMLNPFSTDGLLNVDAAQSLQCFAPQSDLPLDELIHDSLDSGKVDQRDKSLSSCPSPPTTLSSLSQEQSKAINEPWDSPLSYDQIPTGIEQIDPRALQETLTRIQDQVEDSSSNTNSLLVNVTDMRNLLEELPRKICSQISAELKKLDVVPCSERKEQDHSWKSPPSPTPPSQ